jgi:hypothetical protein
MARRSRARLRQQWADASLEMRSRGGSREKEDTLCSTSPGFDLLEYRRRALLTLVPPVGPGGPRADLAIDALRRIEEGIYGFCIRCGTRLPQAVLELEPERPFCTDCERGW